MADHHRKGMDAVSDNTQPPPWRLNWRSVGPSSRENILHSIKPDQQPLGATGTRPDGSMTNVLLRQLGRKWEINRLVRLCFRRLVRLPQFPGLGKQLRLPAALAGWWTRCSFTVCPLRTSPCLSRHKNTSGLNHGWRDKALSCRFRQITMLSTKC